MSAFMIALYWKSDNTEINFINDVDKDLKIYHIYPLIMFIILRKIERKKNKMQQTTTTIANFNFV